MSQRGYTSAPCGSVCPWAPVEGQHTMDDIEHISSSLGQRIQDLTGFLDSEMRLSQRRHLPKPSKYLKTKCKHPNNGDGGSQPQEMGDIRSKSAKVSFNQKNSRNYDDWNLELEDESQGASTSTTSRQQSLKQVKRTSMPPSDGNDLSNQEELDGCRFTRNRTFSEDNHIRNRQGKQQLDVLYSEASTSKAAKHSETVQMLISKYKKDEDDGKHGFESKSLPSPRRTLSCPLPCFSPRTNNESNDGRKKSLINKIVTDHNNKAANVNYEADGISRETHKNIVIKHQRNADTDNMQMASNGLLGTWPQLANIINKGRQICSKYQNTFSGDCEQETKDRFHTNSRKASDHRKWLRNGTGQNSDIIIFKPSGSDTDQYQSENVKRITKQKVSNYRNNSDSDNEQELEELSDDNNIANGGRGHINRITNVSGRNSEYINDKTPNKKSDAYGSYKQDSDTSDDDTLVDDSLKATRQIYRQSKSDYGIRKRTMNGENPYPKHDPHPNQQTISRTNSKRSSSDHLEDMDTFNDYKPIRANRFSRESTHSDQESPYDSPRRRSTRYYSVNDDVDNRPRRSTRYYSVIDGLEDGVNNDINNIARRSTRYYSVIDGFECGVDGDVNNRARSSPRQCSVNDNTEEYEIVYVPKKTRKNTVPYEKRLSSDSEDITASDEYKHQNNRFYNHQHNHRYGREDGHVNYNTSPNAKYSRRKLSLCSENEHKCENSYYVDPHKKASKHSSKESFENEPDIVNRSPERKKNTSMGNSMTFNLGRRTDESSNSKRKFQIKINIIDLSENESDDLDGEAANHTIKCDISRSGDREFEPPSENRKKLRKHMPNGKHFKQDDFEQECGPISQTPCSQFLKSVKKQNNHLNCVESPNYASRPQYSNSLPGTEMPFNCVEYMQALTKSSENCETANPGQINMDETYCYDSNGRAIVSNKYTCHIPHPHRGRRTTTETQTNDYDVGLTWCCSIVGKPYGPRFVVLIVILGVFWAALFRLM